MESGWREDGGRIEGGWREDERRDGVRECWFQQRCSAYSPLLWWVMSVLNYTSTWLLVPARHGHGLCPVWDTHSM